MAGIGSASKTDGIDIQMLALALPLQDSIDLQPHVSPGTSADKGVEARFSRAGQLIGAAASVLASAAQLTQAHAWSSGKAISSNAAVAEAHAPSSPTGEHHVEVQAIASAQITSTAVFSPLSTVIGIGNLRIELGRWDASISSFTANPNWPKATLAVGPNDDSLETIRNKINSAGIGVVASVISDATGSRLVLRSTATGADHGFRVEAVPASAEGSGELSSLRSLSFDPSIDKPDGGMALVQPAQDAHILLDGRQIEASQNLIHDSESGLTLALNGSAGSARIDVIPDQSAAQRTIVSFAQSYNHLTTLLSNATDPPNDAITTNAAAIQRQLYSSIAKPSGDQPVMGDQLALIGISVDAHKLMLIDTDRLGLALNEQADHVRSLFAGTDANSPAGRGIATQLATSPEGQALLADLSPAPGASSAPLPCEDGRGASPTRAQFDNFYSSKPLDQ
jgi:flagellar hook-associated protein 2